MKQTRQLLSLLALSAAVVLAAPAWSQTLPAAQGPRISKTANAAQPSYWIGVAVENIEAATSGWLNLAPGQGLMISKVIKGSPADAAGLVQNDLLIEVNGKPLMDQSQLVDAAQPLMGKSSPVVGPITLAYQRGNQRHSIQIIPQIRPASMQVTWDSAVPATGPSVGGSPLVHPPGQVAINGSHLTIGPGIRLDVNSPLGDTFTREQFKELVQRGQCVIVSQTTDAQGAVHNSITAGDKTYDVSPAASDALPPDIRSLAQSLGWLPAQRPAAEPSHPENGLNATGALDTQLLEKKFQDQQNQIADLQKQLRDLTEKLRQQNTAPQPPQK